jgi:uncharacterized protein (UPF0548 family)
MERDRDVGPDVLPVEVASRLGSAELTYREVGSTRGDLPTGYHHFSRQVPIGRGRREFVRSGAAVQRWQVQLRAGLRVSASSPTIVPGTVAILGFGIGPLILQAPCRVVYTVDEPWLQGFAYGTLAGHPESGEEAFRITAFSRPASRLARVAGPVGVVIQRQITSRYFRSVVRWL